MLIIGRAGAAANRSAPRRKLGSDGIDPYITNP
jgi:hypothetical protein